MKRLLALLTALVLLFSGCGGEPAIETTVPSATEETPPATTEPREKITLSIGMPDNAKIRSFEENALTRWIESQCDVELEFMLYDGSTPASVYPDILFGCSVNEATIKESGRDGLFQDLTAYYADREGASRNFWQRMEECLTPAQQEYVLDRITNAEDGKIYGVPTIATYVSDDRTFQPWINQVWLDQLGLEMPQNTQELYHVLKTFKEADPAGNGSTIPLFGSEKAGGNAQPVDWILNMFLYYNPDRIFQDYNGDGQLEPVYTQPAYREALQFLNKLYKEGLLSNMLYTANSSDMQGIVTPDSEKAMCGIFLGDLTRHTVEGSELLYDYTPMPIWGYGVEEDFYCGLNNFITRECRDLDRAFEVLMTFWSREGTMRVRYGEYGVNWTDADPGTLSALGYPAEYQILEDPLQTTNSAHWGNISCGLFDFLLDGATAQVPEDLSEWLTAKGQMEAKSRMLFEQAKSHTPENLCPYLSYTLEELEQVYDLKYPISNLVTKKEMAFVTGIGAEITGDEDWNAFLEELESLGLSMYTQLAQTAYERHK